MGNFYDKSKAIKRPMFQDFLFFFGINEIYGLFVQFMVIQKKKVGWIGDYKFLWRTPRTSIIWDQRRDMVLPVGGRYLWEYPVLRLQRDSSAANVMICDWCVEIMVALGRKTANSHRSQRPQLHVLDTQKCCIFFFRKLIFVCLC